MNYICPDCGKSGHDSLESLRAHVNASNGHDKWSELVDSIESADNQEPSKRSEEQSDEQTDDQDQNQADSQEPEDMDIESKIESQRQANSSASGAEADEKSASGIPVPIDSTTLLLALAAVVVASYLLSKRSSNTEPGIDQAESEQTTNDSNQSAEMSTGLVQ